MNIRSSIAGTFLSLLLIVSVAGCFSPVHDPVIVETAVVAPAPVSQRRVTAAGRSAMNWPIKSTVYGDGPDVTLIMAGIHGDEQAGIGIVRRLGRYLDRNPHLLSGRKVVIVPIANPDAVARNQRGNANGIDINRNFAASNRINNKTFGYRSLTEPESRAIAQIISRHKPDRIVTIHQPLACIDYDGPALALAQRMARYCRLAVRKLGSRPGSLGSYAGVTLGIATITLELPEAKGRTVFNTQSLWRSYSRSLMAAILYPDTPPATIYFGK